MIKMFFKKVFEVRSYASLDDKRTNPSTVNINTPAGDIISGLVSGVKFKNITGSREFPFNDAVCGEKKVVDIFTRETPVEDVEYAQLPNGSRCERLIVEDGVVVDYEEYHKSAHGFRLVDTVLYKEVTLTNAQAKALNTTAIAFLPAPGADKCYQPIRGFIRHDFLVGAFTLTNVTNIRFKYTNASGAALVQLPTTGVLDQAGVRNAFSLADTNLIGVANAPVVVHAHGTANPGGAATGTVTVGLFYKVVNY